MPSIALLCSNFTGEEELQKQLVAATGCRLCTDEDLLTAAAERFQQSPQQLEQLLFATESDASSFLPKKKQALARFRLILAEELRKKENLLLYGLSTLLVPSAVTHVLRVGIFEDLEVRLQQAVGSGLGERGAAEAVEKNDSKMESWSMLVSAKSVRHGSLYDIFMPTGIISAGNRAQFVLDYYFRSTMQKKAASIQAVEDFYLAAQDALQGE